jgi:hypothetical protein
MSNNKTQKKLSNLEIDFENTEFGILLFIQTTLKSTVYLVQKSQPFPKE